MPARKPSLPSTTTSNFSNIELVGDLAPTVPSFADLPPIPESITVAHANYPMAAWTTDSLALSIDDETRKARRGSSGYNADVPIPQYPCLRARNQDVNDPNFREALYMNSPFLRAHSNDLLWKIVRMGWSYYPKGTDINKQMGDWRKRRFNTGAPNPLESMPEIPPTALPPWDDNLKVKFVEAASTAMSINTTFLCRFRKDHPQPPYGDGGFEVIYRWFTPSHKYQQFLDQFDQIEEIYLKIPQKSSARYRINNVPVKMRIIGFLTQHCPDKAAVPSLGLVPQKFFNLNNDGMITRDCVVIQPYESIDDQLGFPYLYRECQTALEKICLRNYEFAFLSDGGMKIITCVADELDPHDKDALNLQMTRGILSHGLLLELDAGTRNVNEVISSVATPISDLHFQEINSELSEDALLSKQGVEGQAASGALGGSSPIVNKIEDDEVLENMFPWLSRIIQAINWVFFNVPQDSYEVYFNRHADLVQGNAAPNLPHLDERDVPDADDDQTSARAGMNANAIRGDENVTDGVLVANSIRDSYVKFSGNMFQAGEYDYSDSPVNGKVRDTFLPEDIKALSEQTVRSGYLEIDHSYNIHAPAFQDIGDFTVNGFDATTGKDITTFRIRRDIYEKLGSPLKIKLSPYFGLAHDEHGHKKIHVISCAIMKNQHDRATKSGLDASAIKQPEE